MTHDCLTLQSTGGILPNKSRAIGNNGGVFGGGVRNSGTFRMSNGVIYGNNAPVGLRNIANSFVSLDGTVQLGMFDSEGGFTSFSTVAGANATIKVVNGTRVALGDTTITVTGIPPEYHGKLVLLALLAPGMGDWLAWADIYPASSFTTFSVQLHPGDYDLKLFIEGEVAYLYTLPNWTFNAGDNVIPFSSFQLAPVATSFPDNLELLRRSGRAP